MTCALTVKDDSLSLVWQLNMSGGWKDPSQIFGLLHRFEKVWKCIQLDTNLLNMMPDHAWPLRGFISSVLCLSIIKPAIRPATQASFLIIITISCSRDQTKLVPKRAGFRAIIRLHIKAGFNNSVSGLTDLIDSSDGFVSISNIRRPKGPGRPCIDRGLKVNWRISQEFVPPFQTHGNKVYTLYNGPWLWGFGMGCFENFTSLSYRLWSRYQSQSLISQWRPGLEPRTPFSAS